MRAIRFDRSTKLLSLFACFHLVTIITTAFVPSALKTPIFYLSKLYVNFFGLYQNWEMFQSPPSGNYYLCALIRFEDGSKQLIEFPRMQDVSLAERLQLHRLRKFQQSHVFYPGNEAILPDVAQWFANEAELQSKKKVREVVLGQKITPLDYDGPMPSVMKTRYTRQFGKGTRGEADDNDAH